MANNVTGSNDLERLLSSSVGSALGARIKELKEQGLGHARRTVIDNFERSKSHDTLVDICASAFGPSSRAAQDLGYVFVSSDPLVEKGVKNFDLLILCSASDHAIFVECKSSLSSPAKALTDIEDSKRALLEHVDYLQQVVGNKIRLMEFVLCVPSEVCQEVAREMERRERVAGSTREGSSVLLWQVNKFEGQFLQLFTLLPHRKAADSAHRDPRLTKMLAEGIKVESSEVLAKAYPTSHPLRLATEVLVYCITENMRRDANLKEIRRDDVLTFFSDPKNIPHYAVAELGAKLRDRFIRENVDLDLLRETGEEPDRLLLRAEGKTLKTIISNFQKQYLERTADRLAQKGAQEAAIKEFRSTHPPLARFGDSQP